MSKKWVFAAVLVAMSSSGAYARDFIRNPPTDAESLKEYAKHVEGMSGKRLLGENAWNLASMGVACISGLPLELAAQAAKYLVPLAVSARYAFSSETRISWKELREYYALKEVRDSTFVFGPNAPCPITATQLSIAQSAFAKKLASQPTEARSGESERSSAGSVQ